MGRLLTDYLVMLGRAPRRPTRAELSPDMLAIIERNRTPEFREKRRALLKEEQDNPVHSHRWRNRRWASIIIINMLFALSFSMDIQLVEGALTASRVIGFHFADLNSALQVMLAWKQLVVNLAIGTGTVLLLWWIVGGRSFCAWACPYHLLSEIAEMIHLKLAARGLVKDHQLHRITRTVMYVLFSALALATGVTVFEAINPVGIISRSITYGIGMALFWIAALLLIEIIYSRRFWCRYICPVGMTYGFAGGVSPVRVVYTADPCLNEGNCRRVCMVPHVLSLTRVAYSTEVKTAIGPDCTRCGMCVEVCPTGALKFEVKGLNHET